MELRGINRIVVAVNNLEEAKKSYSEAFGATFRQANWTGEAFGIEVAISWDAGIELCAPIKGCEDTSAVSAFLANNGEGVMSVILGVEDALKAKHKAESAGVLAFHSVDYTQEEIKEVVIKSTKLIGVLEIDIKQVPKDRFTRIKINGLPQTYEIGKPKVKDFSSPVAALFQPVDFLYNLFGKKPKQLKKLKQLKKEDGLRKMLAGKFDREVMMEYLQMDRQELTELLSDCNYSEYFIKKASDLQMIEAVLDCYENYKALKKGKIERDKIPEKN